MTRPVSVVIPALGDTGLLAEALPPLFEEFDRRAVGDEVIVVDDTGEDVLAAWLAEHHPRARVLARAENGGFARALTAGIEAATHELVFSMNSDVRVHAGFLEPLIEALAEDVFAVAPRVLLHGDSGEVESYALFRTRRGLLEVAQPALQQADATPDGLAPVAFAVGGTMLLRRADFTGLGGFDPLFEPFYWEDVDLSWRAWRAGKRVLFEPRSVVEHRHRGTISEHGRDAWIRGAIERNRLLFQWKHLDGEELAAHVAALYRWVIDAHLGERREELVWLCMALERAEAALAARGAQPAPDASFGELMRRSSGE